MYKYGATSRDHIIDCVRIACKEIRPQNQKQAIELVLGTTCAETNFGQTDDLYQPQGLGLWQFDKVRFDDVKLQIWTNPEHKSLMLNMFGVRWLSFEQVEYSPLLGAVLCRFGYLFVNAPLPERGDLLGQAKYWKKYWNSNHPNAKGTPEHYMQSVRRNFPNGFPF